MFVLRARPKNPIDPTHADQAFFVAFRHNGAPDWEFLLQQGTRYPSPDYDLQNQAMGYYHPDVWKNYEFDWIEV